MRRNAHLVAVALLVVWAGCGDRSTPAADAGPVRDAPIADRQIPLDAPSRDGAASADRGLPDATPRDLGPSSDAPCTCPVAQVWLRGACVETTKLFTCAPSCDVTKPGGGCATGLRCDNCAAASSCAGSACKPACVIDRIRPLTGPLRLLTTSGAVGSAVKLTVQGARFYVGALFYRVRVNPGIAAVIGDHFAGACAVTRNATFAKAGTYTVEVSQYGGGAPWVLAGFFTAGGTPKGVQPGFRCSAATTCAQGPGTRCACTSGRCQCK